MQHLILFLLLTVIIHSFLMIAPLSKIWYSSASTVGSGGEIITSATIRHGHIVVLVVILTEDGLIQGVFVVPDKMLLLMRVSVVVEIFGVQDLALVVVLAVVVMNRRWQHYYPYWWRSCS